MTSCSTSGGSRASTQYSIGWGRWTVRDLGSSNGTLLGDRKLPLGERATLVVGAELRFGPETTPWQLVDDAEPGAMAVNLVTRQFVVADRGYRAVSYRVIRTCAVDDPNLRWGAAPGLAVALEPVEQVVEIDGVTRGKRLRGFVAAEQPEDVVPLLTFAATRPAFDRRVIHLVLVVGGLVVLTGVSLLYRRALLRNSYHRRMLTFLGALLAVLAAQRVVVLWFDAPAGLALADGALIVIGMSTSGAVFFARWMAAPAGLAAAGFLLWVAAPWAFPAAMVALGPACMVVFGWFWRRDARRGVG